MLLRVLQRRRSPPTEASPAAVAEAEAVLRAALQGLESYWLADADYVARGEQCDRDVATAMARLLAGGQHSVGKPSWQV